MSALLVILVPLLAAGLGPIWLRSGRARLALVPWASLPALALALFGEPRETETWSWLILESYLGLGHSGPAFLFFTAVLWTLAGWYAVGYFKKGVGGGFAAFWLLTMAGNFGLVLAGDLPSFYSFFTLMTLSAYGLVVSGRTPEGWRAGKIYIVLAVLGEALLIAALLLAVSTAESFRLIDTAAAVAASSDRDLILGLGLAGFGVKAGIFPLHFWLPLAHPVAPTPASAVLSGVMIKAGLLGWLHLFPGGVVALPGWSAGMIILGLWTAFYGVGCGLGQRNLKTILAYSSISQMGILLLVVGSGLAVPEAWGVVTVVVVVYALNHALAKGALFLGIGVCEGSVGAGCWTKRWILAGLTLPVLAIAGAPLMGGAIAKNAVKLAVELPSEVVPGLRILLPLSAVATTLILGRFLLLAGEALRVTGEPHRVVGGVQLWAWIVAVGAAMGGVYFAIPWYGLELGTAESGWLGVWENLWPLLVGAVGLGLARLWPAGAWRPRLPPGDLVVALERLAGHLGRKLSWLVGEETWRIDFHPVINRVGRSQWLQSFMQRGESFLRQKETAGFLMMLFVLVLWWLLGP
jgi:formate hydrogenlyase subunit 3/multisubunit Na+/H+ antiporter MnhD subunit